MANTAQLDRAHDGSLHSWLAAFLAKRNRRARGALLDVRELPDHLKRDMGFLDGNPVGRGK